MDVTPNSPISLDLTGQFALVTAGAQGIGLAITKALLAQGAEVQVCDIDTQALAKVKQELPAVHTRLTDISKEVEVSQLFSEIQKRWGKLNILVNNAGIAGPTAKIEYTLLKDWQDTEDVNLT